MRVGWNRFLKRLTVLALGSAFLFGGCSPQTRAAVADGVINVSTSLVGALVTSWIQLWAEQQSQTTP